MRKNLEVQCLSLRVVGSGLSQGFRHSTAKGLASWEPEILTELVN